MKVAIIGARRRHNGIGEYIAKYFHQNGCTVVALLGTKEKDLANILRFSAFWLDKMQQHQQWTKGDQ